MLEITMCPSIKPFNTLLPTNSDSYSGPHSNNIKCALLSDLNSYKFEQRFRTLMNCSVFPTPSFKIYNHFPTDLTMCRLHTNRSPSRGRSPSTRAFSDPDLVPPSPFVHCHPRGVQLVTSSN